MATIFLTSALVAAAAFIALWLVSLVVRDASIVDPFWGTAFALVAWVAYGVADSPGSQQLLTAVLVTVWGIRLSVFLAIRNLGGEEDYRYQAMRRRWGDRFPLVSLGTVFILQAVLMWVVSLPVQATMSFETDPGALTLVGIAVWAVGLSFEAIGDWQLARFKRDPANDGKVLNTGLWRYTRHPNYFGDFCVWWGIYLVAIAGSSMAWTVVGPIVMSVLLLKVSGVGLLEKTIATRRPAYADYVRSTSAFFPWRPKQR